MIEMMTERAVRVFTLCIGLALIAMANIGCSSTPRMGKYDIVVTPDATLRDSSGTLSLVEVDLVGVTAQQQEWESYPVDTYFSGSDALRRGASEYTYRMTFGPNDAGPKTLKSDDPIWEVWKGRGVTSMVIMGSSRQMRPAAGAPETRRKLIPLTTDRWKTERIDVVVKSSGIEIPTPMEPVKAK